MTDWQLIQSYWQHFYKLVLWQPNLYSQILRDNDLEEKEENLNYDEERGEEKIGEGGE